MYLLVSRRRDVDDAGGLLALQVGDEAGREVGGLLQHVHVVAPARQRQQRAVFVLQLGTEWCLYHLLSFYTYYSNDLSNYFNINNKWQSNNRII